MSYNLAKKIEEYSEEIFSELGGAALPEERKAELYARIQESIHQKILSALEGRIEGRDFEKLQKYIEEESYDRLGDIFAKYQHIITGLEKGLEQDFTRLKIELNNSEEKGSQY